MARSWTMFMDVSREILRTAANVLLSISLNIKGYAFYVIISLVKDKCNKYCVMLFVINHLFFSITVFTITTTVDCRHN